MLSALFVVCSEKPFWNVPSHAFVQVTLQSAAKALLFDHIAPYDHFSAAFSCSAPVALSVATAALTQSQKCTAAAQGKQRSCNLSAALIAALIS